MSANEILLTLLACAIGLILGSVLPAEILSRRRGVDIRTVGDGNPGTVNAIKGLGWGLGLAAGAYDALVGIVAIEIARLLGLSDGPAYLAGLMTIVGHRFPVFYGFRDGGQGMAASAGLLVYGIATALHRGWLSPIELGVLVGVVVVTVVVTRSDIAVAIALLPVLLGMLVLAEPGWVFLAFMTVVAGHIWIVQLNVLRHKSQTHAREANAH